MVRGSVTFERFLFSSVFSLAVRLLGPNDTTGDEVFFFFRLENIVIHFIACLVHIGVEIVWYNLLILYFISQMLR